MSRVLPGKRAQMIVSNMIKKGEISLPDDQVKILQHRIRDELIAQDHETRSTVYMAAATNVDIQWAEVSQEGGPIVTKFKEIIRNIGRL